MRDLQQPIHVRLMGEGARDVLAIHCTIAHSGAWKRLASLLSEEATFHAFDMLSHGQSADWDGHGDFQDRNVEAALSVLERPMDVVGHSFGATVALRAAVERPDLVRSLTLIEPVFFAVALQDAPALVAEHDRIAQPYQAAMQAGDWPLAARLFNRMWSTDGGPRWPQLPEATRAAMIRGIPVVPACDAALFDDRAGVLAPGVLDGLSMPVMLLRGGQSQPVIGSINGGLARRIPGAIDHVVDGAGHMVPISHPQDVAQHLKAFWR
ncbi:haloalkane dehalogenase [Falsiruegeria litorea R37]|uniref:Haloalkane dehalogenase n=1 Tax=Falsiruegeria litorea R37 TaxID=1200284 RepID=A0A1Y5RXV7_9RHOB|nr:alpha/beta hydrolase [Falsiruegeria litorea]SLN28078.1 haloalkane dehalogenase [Falsiruegeria litorea R37]